MSTSAYMQDEHPLVLLHDPHGQGAEDVRALRNALALRWFQHPEGAKTLAVVGVEEHEGNVAVAGNLAIACAQAGLRTLLIDADLLSRPVQRLFGITERVGLAGYLAGRITQSASPTARARTSAEVGGASQNSEDFLLQPSEQRQADDRLASHTIDAPVHPAGVVANLWLMPAGPPVAHSQELLLRGLFAPLIRRLAQSYDAVVVNAPPATTSDFLLIGAQTEGALIVTTGGETTVAAARALVTRCREFGIRLVGSTMVAPR